MPVGILKAFCCVYINRLVLKTPNYKVYKSYYIGFKVTRAHKSLKVEYQSTLSPKLFSYFEKLLKDVKEFTSTEGRSRTTIYSRTLTLYAP